MANPRKFSEKIALHNHREAEETAAFEKIMREVKEVKGKDEPSRPHRTPGSRAEPRGRTHSQSGPMRKPHERRLDTSPYHLSPLIDTGGCRRANSDSALHQSAMQGMSMDRNNDYSNRGWPMPILNGPDRNHQDRRPKSSCDIPSQSRVPGINIHPSAHDPSLVQIPMANTGSLPDLTNVDFTSPLHPLDQDHDSPQFSTNQLTVPFYHRYQQQQNFQLDKNLVNLTDNSNYTQLPGLTGMYQHCPSTSPSPTQTGAYRSPRPSPQSSPSPGRHSAPCSPGATSPLPNEYHILNQQTSQFQQHFEQLSMLDSPNSMPYVDQLTGAPHQGTQPHSPSNIQNTSPISSIELMSTDAGYCSPTQQQFYSSPSPGLRTTPNTPTSLPEIVLTDFSQDDGRTDIFDESLKEGLGTLDFDEFQMLTNSSIGISEIVEDHFRLDHRS